MLRLKFVEIAGEKTEKVFLENKTQVIGHDPSCTIKPRISNGHISRKHCTVVFNEAENNWTVIDGTLENNRASKNGLWNAAGEKVNGHIILKKEGDIIYLLNISTGQAYLQVFETEKVTLPPQATSGLELQIAQINTKTDTAVEKLDIVKDEVVANRNNIIDVRDTTDVLSTQVHIIADTLETVRRHVETVGTKPKTYLMGAMISFLMAMLAIAGFATYSNIDQIVNRLINQKLDERSILKK